MNTESNAMRRARGTSKVQAKRMRGKPGDVPRSTVNRIKKMRSRGLSYGDIAHVTGLAKSTVRYHAAHADVLQERKHHRAAPRVIQACTTCRKHGHNAATCDDEENK